MPVLTVSPQTISAERRPIPPETPFPLVPTAEQSGVVTNGAALSTVGLMHAPTFPEEAVLYLVEEV